MQDGNGDLLAGSHISNRMKNLSQLLNVHGVSDVMQIKIHIAEQITPERCPSDFQSPCCDQIVVDVIQARGKI
jgi:hypothetical protein